MKREEFDQLGDRMKAIEALSEGTPFDPLKPLYARVDGHGFSRFTADLTKPFDTAFASAMVITARRLMEETGARLAYVQSDEISLGWGPATEDYQTLPFSGRPMKMATTLAGKTTALFINALLDPTLNLQGANLHRKVAEAPHFDARYAQPETIEDLADKFRWRGHDAFRNGIQMLGQAHFTQKELHRKSVGAIIRMLAEKGIHLDDQPHPALNGTLLYRHRVKKTLNETERMAIPEKSRPAADQIFERSVISMLDCVPVEAILNLEDVLSGSGQALTYRFSI